jgi:quercetin dioxygenase-like cupin family protein
MRSAIHGVLEQETAMQFGNLPFMTTDWNSIHRTEHPGASGLAVWRTVQAGDVRIRMVEYSPGYVADHWCSRGHVLLVLEGELLTELQDGRVVRLTPGMSYQVANDDVPHRSRTQAGAKLFVVD